MTRIRLFHTPELVPYPQAVTFMESYVGDILNNGAEGALWLLEHPPVITAGTSAQSQDIILPSTIPICQTGRGGKHTYHGPGQRIVYIMLDLNHFNKDLRHFVRMLEQWLMNTFATIGLKTCSRKNRVGIWVPESTNHQESKIAAIGLRVKRWVTYHGVAINVSPDLNHFQTIVPCGIKDLGVTSLANEGINLTMSEIDDILIQEFYKLFQVRVLT
jgi:lipoyl(octanoyl) transferase